MTFCNTKIPPLNFMLSQVETFSIIRGPDEGAGEGLVNCPYTFCGLCMKSFSPIRLQLNNLDHEYNCGTPAILCTIG